MVNRKSQFIERFGDPITNPKGWPVMQLQDIVSDDCSISYGIVKPGDDVPDGVPVFRPVDIVGKKPEITELKRTSKAISDQYKRTLLTGRELLLTVRANIGDTCIIGDEFKGCNVGRGIVPIRVKEDLMSLEFLKCQMDFDTMHDYIQSLSKGITLIQLNMEDLRKIAFIVPPVDLQKEYLSIVRQSDKSKFTVGRRFKSQFIERFGGIDEQHIRPLSEVCTLITDGTHNPPKFVNEGIPFLLVSNITGDVITYDTTKFITEATYNELIKRTPVEIGDVLLSTVGSYGHPALVEDSTKFSFQRHIALLKPNKTLIDSRFLHTSILAPDAQRQIDELVQGVAQKTLNLSAIKKIHIPVPSMDAQAAFIRFVRQSDKSKLSVQNKLSAFRRLTYRILQFEGGLRNV